MPDKIINFDIINLCIKKLKPHKDDGNHGFKCDHIIIGLNKPLLLLSIISELSKFLQLIWVPLNLKTTPASLYQVRLLC